MIDHGHRLFDDTLDTLRQRFGGERERVVDDVPTVRRIYEERLLEEQGASQGNR